jgi:DNA-3-methyladenine glycosylase
VTFGELVAGSVHDVAPALIGWTLLHDGVGGRIVEVEAYHQDDPASHSYRGPTPRNGVMFGPSGYLYVYRSYGIHWCANIVCDAVGTGAAVLLRALEPTHRLDVMRERRALEDERLLCAGPGRVCQALAVTRDYDGLPLDRPPFALHARKTEPEIVTGPRIGISKAKDLPWRYGLAGSRFLSRSFRPRG